MFDDGTPGARVVTDIVRRRLAQHLGGIGLGGTRLGAKLARQRLGQTDGQGFCHTGIVTQASGIAQMIYRAASLRNGAPFSFKAKQIRGDIF